MTVTVQPHPRPTEAAILLSKEYLGQVSITSRIPERLERLRSFVVQRTLVEDLQASNSDAQVWTIIVNAWAADRNVADPLGIVHDLCLDIHSGWISEVNVPQAFPFRQSQSGSVTWHSRGVAIRSWGEIDVENVPNPSDVHRTGMSMLLDVEVSVMPYIRIRPT